MTDQSIAPLPPEPQAPRVRVVPTGDPQIHDLDRDLRQVVDALGMPSAQAKAVKALLSRTLWGWWDSHRQDHIADSAGGWQHHDAITNWSYGDLDAPDAYWWQATDGGPMLLAPSWGPYPVARIDHEFEGPIEVTTSGNRFDTQMVANMLRECLAAAPPVWPTWGTHLDGIPGQTTGGVPAGTEPHRPEQVADLTVADGAFTDGR